MDSVSLENVTNLAEKLPPEEQLILVEKLAQNLRRRVRADQRKGKQPQNLYGIWQTAVSPDFDIDAALSEIRGDYKTEFEENS